MDDGQIALAKKLMANRETSIDDICRAVGVSRSTLYRYAGKREG